MSHLFYDKQGNADKIQVFKMQHGVVCLVHPYYGVYHTKFHFRRLSGITWRKRNVYCNYSKSTITNRVSIVLLLANSIKTSITCHSLCLKAYHRPNYLLCTVECHRRELTLNPTSLSGTEPRAFFGFLTSSCNFLSITKNFVLCTVLLLCLVSKLKK